MAAIALEEVSKFWGPTKAVDRISFSTDSGRFVVLLGPSGCGKSTTLRLIAGLEQAHAGRIFIAGEDVTGLPPARRHIAMVFQSYALFPHLSVAENILFGLKVRGVAAGERETRLKKTAALLGLSELLERKPSQLSGGQQQRVALGRAIIAEHPVCLMDEPLSNLDAQLRSDMRREIRALQQNLGITMVYVTHDQAEAMSMADQVVLLREGRIEQDATPDELYARPRTIFAARFIGTPPMNVVPVRAILAAQPRWASRVPGEASRLAVGVRPEDITLGEEGVPARVVSAEYLGADSILACAIGGEHVAVRAQGRARVAAGECVQLSWADASAHWFDLDTGERRDELSRAAALA